MGDGIRYRFGRTKTGETSDSDRQNVFVYDNGPLPSFWSGILGAKEKSDSHFLLSVDTANETALANLGAALDEIESQIFLLHSENWENIWEEGNVIFGDGDDMRLQQVVKSSLYYLYSSLPSSRTYSSNNHFGGLSPGGLANGKEGRDYQGHVFWDMETWMFPPILLFRPDLARKMLNYRLDGVSEAIRRAQEGDYDGARFPWESARTGVEVTPDICPACRENQQHITGDIALATRQYIAMTDDREWLRTAETDEPFTANEFVVEMAKFWVSRPEFNEERGKFEINHVMPPDEYAEDINNSIYTNLLATYAVHTARWTTCLAEGVDQAEATITHDMIEQMKDVVFNYNEEKGYHEEYDGFADKVDAGAVGPGGVKQADVILLGFPLMWSMPDEVRRNDLLLYEGLTNADGPAMTWGMFAVNWLELGEWTKAEDLFRRSYASYVRDPFMVWTEVQSGLGAVNFMTGMGGFLQALVFGYGGVRIHPEAIEVLGGVAMPEGVSELTLQGLEYKGAAFLFRRGASETTVICLGGSSTHKLAFQSAEGTKPIETGKWQKHAEKRFVELRD